MFFDHVFSEIVEVRSSSSSSRRSRRTGKVCESVPLIAQDKYRLTSSVEIDRYVCDDSARSTGLYSVCHK